MVAHRDTNACHDNVRHVRCQCSSPQFITPWSEINLTFIQPFSDLGGLVVSVLASGTQDRGFKPG